MSTLAWMRLVHLIAAATWLGGLITLAAVVVALRREGVDRSVLQAAARQFGRLSWTAMAIALITGTAQVYLLPLPWAYGPLQTKLGLVALTILIAGVHQFTARNSSPRARGLIQVAIMLASVGVFAAAVAL